MNMLQPVPPASLFKIRRNCSCGYINSVLQNIQGTLKKIYIYYFVEHTVIKIIEQQWL